MDNETLRAPKRSEDDEMTKEHTDWRATKQRARLRDKGTSGREDELTLKRRNDDDTKRREDHQLTGKPQNDEEGERMARGRKDDELRSVDSLPAEHRGSLQRTKLRTQDERITKQRENDETMRGPKDERTNGRKGGERTKGLKDERTKGRKDERTTNCVALIAYLQSTVLTLEPP
jgi:hypothetical protein